MLKGLSLVGLIAMIAALLELFAVGSLLSSSPVVVASQIGAILLIVWARIAFGFRSFHALGDPTSGGLVTSGPYAYIRHPIYTAGCVFGWAGILAHVSLMSIGLGAVLVGGGIVRMLCEERLVEARYPAYREYSARTKRMIPFVY